MAKKSIFTNPWVLGGGAVLGLVILLSNRGGGGGGGAVDPGMIATTNAAAMQMNMGLAQIAAEEAGLRFQHDATIAGYAFEALTNRINSSAALLMQQSASRAGIVNASIVGNTMAIQERAKMMIGMDLARVESDPAFKEQMRNPGSSPQLRDSKHARNDKYQKKERKAVGFGKHLTKGGFEGWTVQIPGGGGKTVPPVTGVM